VIQWELAGICELSRKNGRNQMDHDERPWLKFYDHSQTPDTLSHPDISLYETVRIVSVRFPENIAYEFMGRQISYKDFVEKIDHVAACLFKMGVKKGDRILICMRSDINYDTSALGEERDQILH
jgi:hypothetical protein